MKNRTRALARTGLSAALGLALLFLAGVLPTGRLAVVCVAGMLTAFVLISVGLPWSIGCFVATALLALLLPAQKGPGLLYAAFLGYYPIIRLLLERRRAAMLRLICKLAVFNAAFLLLLAFASAVMADTLPADWSVLLLVAAGNAGFLFYDLALSQVILFYLRRLVGKMK